MTKSVPEVASPLSKSMVRGFAMMLGAVTIQFGEAFFGEPVQVLAIMMAYFMIVGFIGGLGMLTWGIVFE